MPTPGTIVRTRDMDPPAAAPPKNIQPVAAAPSAARATSVFAMIPHRQGALPAEACSARPSTGSRDILEHWRRPGISILGQSATPTFSYPRRVDVSVQRETDGRFLVKLVTDEREVDIRLSATDIRALVGSAHWSERGTVEAGESVGSPVFRASDGNTARLLIGRDDVAIGIPFRVMDEIVRGAVVSEVQVTFTRSYESPWQHDDLV